MKAYHRDIVLPQGVKIPSGSIKPHYSHHAQEEAQLDMGIMNLPSELKFTEENVVEVYTQGQKIVKYLLRISYDSKKDICFIIEPEEDKVITNWFNMKADRHMTLNREKYQLK